MLSARVRAFCSGLESAAAATKLVFVTPTPGVLLSIRPSGFGPSFFFFRPKRASETHSRQFNPSSRSRTTSLRDRFRTRTRDDNDDDRDTRGPFVAGGSQRSSRPAKNPFAFFSTNRNVLLPVLRSSVSIASTVLHYRHKDDKTNYYSCSDAHGLSPARSIDLYEKEKYCLIIDKMSAVYMSHVGIVAVIKYEYCVTHRV